MFATGKLVDYEVRDISPDTSFLEMLDILNENLLRTGGEPIAFDSDCREGICGPCALPVNGETHVPDHPGRGNQAQLTINAPPLGLVAGLAAS